MSKIVKSVGTGFIGVVCFIYVTFSMIHMSRVNSKMDEWNESYRAIEEDVSAFTKLSDPKTIRLYVKELNKILDNIHFLSKIVESGQLSDESLLNILNGQVLINEQLVDMEKYIKFVDYNFKDYAMLQDTVDVGQWDDILLLKQSIESVKQNMESGKLKFETIRTDIDDIKTMIDDLKDSKINKFW